MTPNPSINRTLRIVPHNVGYHGRVELTDEASPYRRATGKLIWRMGRTGHW